MGALYGENGLDLTRLQHDPKLAATLLAAGVEDPGKFMNGPLAWTGDETAARVGAMGRGVVPTKNAAFSAAEGDRNAARDVQGDMQKIGYRLKHDPASQALAQLLGGTGPDGMGVPAPQGVGALLSPGEEAGNKIFQIGAMTGNPKLLALGNTISNQAGNRAMREEGLVQGQVDRYTKAADSYSGFVDALTNMGDDLKKYPAGTDIPGMGETGGIPSIMLSPEGQKVRQDFKAVQNGIVYLLSGKQINNEEGKRLAEQLGGTIENGTFRITKQFTDDQLRRGIENVTRQIQRKLKNTGAHLSPQALERYKEQAPGGVLPDYLDEMVNGFGAPQAGEWTPEDEARLQELERQTGGGVAP